MTFPSILDLAREGYSAFGMPAQRAWVSLLPGEQATWAHGAHAVVKATLAAVVAGTLPTVGDLGEQAYQAVDTSPFAPPWAALPPLRQRQWAAFVDRVNGLVMAAIDEGHLPDPEPPTGPMGLLGLGRGRT
jgi:hypothetical protein